MTGFANFTELSALVVDYAHRPDLLERAENFFIQLASLRIGRDLRSQHNETVAELDGTVLGDPMALPDDFGSIRSVWFQGSRGPNALVSKDEVSITLVETQGDRPRAYMIRDGNLYPRPFNGGKYLLSYHTVPVLDVTNDTNAVLTNYPQAYLYAALIELHVWTQDKPNRDQALEFYTSELRAINRQQSRARANAPASLGV